MVGLLAGTGVIGASAVLVDLAAADPVTVGVYRLGYAMVALWGLVALECRLRRLPFRWDVFLPARGGAAAGALFAASVVLQNMSIDRLGAGLATVLDNTHVVILALGSWVASRRRPPSAVLGSVIVVMVGIGLVAWPGRGAAVVEPMGVVAALLTALAYAAYLALLPPRLSPDRSPDRSPSAERRPTLLPVCHIVTSAFPVVLLVAVVTGADLAPPIGAHGWMLALALGPQVVGWTLLTAASRAVPVVTTGLVLTLQPVFTVLLAAPVLGEWPSPRQAWGSAVVLLGLAICIRGQGPGPVSASAPLTAQPPVASGSR